MLTVLSDRPYTTPCCGHLHIWLSRATSGTRRHLSIVWLVITSCLPTITLTMFLETFKTIESLPWDLVGSRSRAEEDEDILRCNFLKLTPGDRYFSKTAAPAWIEPLSSIAPLLLSYLFHSQSCGMHLQHLPRLPDPSQPWQQPCSRPVWEPVSKHNSQWHLLLSPSLKFWRRHIFFLKVASFIFIFIYLFTYLFGFFETRL